MGSILLGWLALAGATLTLFLLGRGPLGTPPLLHPDRALLWWHERGPVLATFAALREVALGVGCYLGSLWTAAVVVALLRSARLATTLCRCRLPAAPALGRALLGLSTAGAVWITSAGSSFAVGSNHAGNPSPRMPPERASGAPVLRYVGPMEPPVLRNPGPTRRAGRAARSHVRAPKPAPAPAIRVPDPRPISTWTVRPGDDLWSIAEATLAKAWGDAPGPADLARYWWRVVQVNRADLPVPADPSLLFPGDRISLPPIPTRPAEPVAPAESE